jgi:hypothetical protein
MASGVIRSSEAIAIMDNPPRHNTLDIFPVSELNDFSLGGTLGSPPPLAECINLGDFMVSSHTLRVVNA